MRKRDTRFATQERCTTLPNRLHDTSRPMKKTMVVFGPEDFRYDPVARTCICPAGKSLHRRGAANLPGCHAGRHFQGAQRDGGPCPWRAQCLRTPGTTPVRRANTRRDRFTRRGRAKVDTPWTLYCLVHNIEKPANNGYAA